MHKVKQIVAAVALAAAAGCPSPPPADNTYLERIGAYMRTDTGDAALLLQEHDFYMCDWSADAGFYHGSYTYGEKDPYMLLDLGGYVVRYDVLGDADHVTLEVNGVGAGEYGAISRQEFCDLAAAHCSASCL